MSKCGGFAATILLNVLCGCAGSHQPTIAGEPNGTTRPATDPAGEATLREAMALAHVAGAVPSIAPLDTVAYSDDPTTQAYLTAQSDATRAGHRLEAAVESKLGAESARALGLMRADPGSAPRLMEELKRAGDPYPDELDKARISEHDDSATIRLASGEVQRARRIAGRWKFEFPDIRKVLTDVGAGRDRPEPASTIADYRAAAHIDDQVAAKVLAGKLTTSDQVKTERARLLGATKNARPAF